MSKVIKAALIAAIVFTAGAITVGFAAGSMTALTFGAGLGLTATGMAVFTFVTTLVGGLIGGMGSKGGAAGGDNFGAKFAARGAITPRQIVYGQCRVGGTYVHMSTSGTDNSIFHGVIVLAGHEIQSLEKIKINDTELTTATNTINSETVFRVSNRKFINTDNDKLFSGGHLLDLSLKMDRKLRRINLWSPKYQVSGKIILVKVCFCIYTWLLMPKRLVVVYHKYLLK